MNTTNRDRVLMLSEYRESAAEQAARKSPTCVVCGKDNEGVPLLCCWQCFKHQTPSGFAPLKHAGLPFSDWLEKARVQP